MREREKAGQHSSPDLKEGILCDKPDQLESSKSPDEVRVFRTDGKVLAEENARVGGRRGKDVARGIGEGSCLRIDFGRSDDKVGIQVSSDRDSSVEG